MTSQIDLTKYDFLNEVRYDAECPKIDFFLNKSLGESGTRDFLFLAALMCRKDKPVWLPHIFLGNGATGKTTAAFILRALCRDDNYTSWRCVETTSQRGKQVRKESIKYSRLNVCDSTRKMRIDMKFLEDLLEEAVGTVFIFTCTEVPEIFEQHKLWNQFKILNFQHSAYIDIRDRTQEIITQEELEGFKKKVIQIGIPALEAVYG